MGDGVILRYIAIALILALGGCAGFAEKATLASDKAAKALLRAPCGMTIGAHYRQASDPHEVTKAFAEEFCR